ncbi:hypothetical protein PZ897_02045 [Hoeflea sp. YIM 152468]|uniref:hypothetical protein n=1 Tax=Hoeflea sp. YIM 152468 TaxID=3031759 RepID=UPI0023D9CCAA|nr:hypothetical protein [Hoeflea sp. YIM 152468]MDF1606952.1 hypothetical protein [Hoeflea sp. YIM 152468]
MKKITLLTLALSAGSASADQPTITDACQRAAEHHWNASGSIATDVQAFPDLSPPRVRMRIAVELPNRPSRVAALLSGEKQPSTHTVDQGEVECSFSHPTAPFGLSQFCPPEGCWLISPSRLEELQELMRRDGL